MRRTIFSPDSSGFDIVYVFYPLSEYLPERPYDFEWHGWYGWMH